MKLSDKIHLLKLDFEITLSPDKKLPRFVNILLIFGKKITLVDTGVKGCEKLIFEYIREQKRDLSEIETIILSHSHPDHIGSAATIKELTGCKVLAHKAENNWIENIENQNQERPVPGFFMLVDRSVMVDDFLEDGQELKIDTGLTLKFIHSPGHSKGSLNILFKENKFLFTADSIPLKNDIPNYDNFRAVMKSLEAIKNNKEYILLLSSWTPPISEKSEMDKLIMEGEEYIMRIDSNVKKYYSNSQSEDMDACKKVITELGLPPFLANPLVDKTFRSHLL